MNNREKILKKLNGVNEEAKTKYRFAILGLFGSYARGTQNKKSDIDILVEPMEGADLFSLGGLSIFLERKLAHKVDVVPERNIRAELREAIEREVVRI